MYHWVVVSNIFYFHPYLGKIPILTHIFQRGWNHQLDQHVTSTKILGSSLLQSMFGHESGDLVLIMGSWIRETSQGPIVIRIAWNCYLST